MGSFFWVTMETKDIEGVYSAPSSALHNLPPPHLEGKIRMREVNCVEKSNSIVSSSEQGGGE